MTPTISPLEDMPQRCYLEHLSCNMSDNSVMDDKGYRDTRRLSAVSKAIAKSAHVGDSYHAKNCHGVAKAAIHVLEDHINIEKCNENEGRGRTTGR